jgi:alcohol dehydrogenase
MEADAARVVVVTGPGRLEVVELPIPETGDDDGLLLVETNGVCGSDLELIEGSVDGYSLPMVLGHEPAGRIIRLGPAAQKRLGLKVGDRVAVNSQLRCGHCDGCRQTGTCLTFPGTYGTMPAAFEPGLWGGFATHMYLSPSATMVRVADTVTRSELAFHNPLANGFEWAVQAGQVGQGSDVLILGAGPRGIACALASLFVDARQVTLAGLGHDRARLDMARVLGVHRTVVVETNDADELRDTTGSHHLVIDTTPGSGSAVRQAVSAVADGGRLVLGGLKGRGVTFGIDVDIIVRRRLTMVGPPSKSTASFSQAVEALNSGRIHLEPMTTQAYPLERTLEAIKSITATDLNRPLHVRVDPQL